MSEGGKGGFVLTPSRLGKPPGEGPTKPKFTGLKQSKLGSSVGILADSKLASSNSAVVPSSETADPQKQTGGPKAGDLKPAPTFSFTPLTKEDTENSLFTNTDAVQTKIKDTSIKTMDAAKPVFGSGLVFGEKLEEKAVVPDKPVTQEEQKTEEKEEKPSETKPTSHLFSSVSADPKSTGEEAKTLSESAAEFTESQTNKRKYDEVAVVTGEEEESNVLQSNVKLYIFDTATKNWQERGRGQIRLNDAPASTPGHIQSRLVMRTHGSLRVVLNTKLWPEMVCEKVNEKNIRISGWDEDVVRIFLLTLSAKDAEKLHNALECRLSQLEANKEVEGEPSAKKDKLADEENPE